jgi:hypothetical protein
MFELHVVVASVAMFNILKLIIEIMPNYPTYFFKEGKRFSDSLIKKGQEFDTKDHFRVMIEPKCSAPPSSRAASLLIIDTTTLDIDEIF